MTLFTDYPTLPTCVPFLYSQMHNSIARFTGEVMFCPMRINASIITGIVPHNCRGVFTMGESHARIGYRRRRIYRIASV